MALLDGLSPVFLQSQLAAMQSVYLQLLSGQKIATASYTQGDGAKSVTYESASIPNLIAGIQVLQTQIAALSGRRLQTRRPITPYF